MKPLALSALRLSDPLDHRIQLSLNHLLSERGRILGGEGFGQAWGADQQGRWIGAVALAGAYQRQPQPVLAETVRSFLSTQALNGFFGQAFNSLTWWGAGRGLIGLLEYWEVSQDAAALAAATRLGEFYLANFPLDGDGFATHHGGHTEGLVALWQATGRAEFLELAAKIPATEMAEFGRPGERTPGQHTHSYLTATRGCLDLYLATGRAEFLQRARAVWEQVLEHQMWVSGGISEGSHYAFETRDETCSVADWLRLSLKLWQASGDPRCLDVAEHVLLNHLGFDQDHTGGFCSYRSVGENPAGQVRDVVTWFCCSMHGLRALLEAARFIYAYDADRLAVNLFIASQAEVPLAAGNVRVTQTLNSPLGPARLRLEPDGPLSFTLDLRVPAWATSFTLTLNNQPVTQAPVDGRLVLQRTWQPGDTLELAWDAQLRLVPADVAGFGAPSQAEPLQQAALAYGPLVLMLDPTLNIYEMWEWGPAELAVPSQPDGQPFLLPIPAPILGRGALAVLGAGFMTLARQRGAPDSDEAWKLAFLVPIAELTDRWSFTMARPVPYEVRNDVRLLPPNEVPGYQACLIALFDAFANQRQADTAL